MKLLERLGFPSAEEMATKSSAVALAEATPPVAVVPNVWKPKPSLSSDENAEYLKVAASIGLSSSPIQDEKLRRFLTENGLDCYSSRGVGDFLDIKLGKGQWIWAGLRPVDCEELTGTWTCTMGRGRKIHFSDKPYSRKVPLPVLLTVQKIAEAVPEVRFYVSQSKDENADPFLLVTNRELGLFIVERWDEPNFRDR